MRVIIKLNIVFIVAFCVVQSVASLNEIDSLLMNDARGEENLAANEAARAQKRSQPVNYGPFSTQADANSSPSNGRLQPRFNPVLSALFKRSKVYGGFVDMLKKSLDDLELAYADDANNNDENDDVQQRQDLSLDEADLIVSPVQLLKRNNPNSRHHLFLGKRDPLQLNYDLGEKLKLKKRPGKNDMRHLFIGK